jgi:hypothetical protein
MALLGSAAMLLSFDVTPEAISEHDEWHTREHLPERLSIPGFRRGTRWTALLGEPRYFVLYEVEELATLVSDAYLERLNHPSPWTSRMMPSYRGMARGFCSVTSGIGAGIGHVGLLIRFEAAAEPHDPARKWLLEAVLHGLASRRGVGSAHLFDGTLAPPMTNEQRIRGADARIDRAFFVTGYDREVLAGLMQVELGRTELEAHGIAGARHALYRLAYSLTDREVDDAS